MNSSGEKMGKSELKMFEKDSMSEFSIDFNESNSQKEEDTNDSKKCDFGKKKSKNTQEEEKKEENSGSMSEPSESVIDMFLDFSD